MLGTWYGPIGTRNSISLDNFQIFPLLIYSDSRDPIFNSTDPNQVPLTRHGAITAQM